MHIKICGIRRIQDALFAEALGIEFLGFNFVPGSPRYISPADAAEIIQEMDPDTKCVGVFQNASEAEVREAIAVSGVDCLQFHGTEDAKFLKKFEQTKIKVFALDSGFKADSIKAFEEVADYFLFDAKVGKQTGGTGQTFDWSLLPKTAKPYFLAGGIGPENIAEAIAATQPWAIDLNSKVEKSPGVKDLNKIRQCIEKMLGETEND